MVPSFQKEWMSLMDMLILVSMIMLMIKLLLMIMIMMAQMMMMTFFCESPLRMTICDVFCRGVDTFDILMIMVALIDDDNDDDCDDDYDDCNACMMMARLLR